MLLVDVIHSWEVVVHDAMVVVVALDVDKDKMVALDVVVDETQEKMVGEEGHQVRWEVVDAAEHRDERE